MCVLREGKIRQWMLKYITFRRGRSIYGKGNILHIGKKDQILRGETRKECNRKIGKMYYNWDFRLDW